MGLLVHAKIVNLHPEIHFLIALEYDWLTIRGSYPRPHLGIADHKHSRANFFRRNRRHDVSYDQRGRCQAVVLKAGYGQSAAPQSRAITVDILHRDIDAIQAWPQR